MNARERWTLHAGCFGNYDDRIGSQAQHRFAASLIYDEGNFIEATRDTPYFQIGERKYGKPVIRRVVRCNTEILDATKFALVSFDSTMRSNISVGLPIDILVYVRDTFRIGMQRRGEEDDPCFSMIHQQ